MQAIDRWSVIAIFVVNRESSSITHLLIVRGGGTVPLPYVRGAE